MKILVTGANGQLGRSLAKIAGEYTRHTFVFTDLPEADITDRAAMAALAARHAPDAIINCAAYTAVDRAESEPQAALRVNRDGAAAVAAIAAQRGVPLIHISTDYVFDGLSTSPITEDAAPNPLGVYGSTKLAGEDSIRLSGCDGAVVRTSWLYSEYGHNFVKTMLSLGQKGCALRVVDDQTGCPTYATNLAHTLLSLLERGVAGLTVYNYCDRGPTTWYAFARKIFQLSGIAADLTPVTTAQYGAAAPRPPYSVLSTRKIEGLGIAPPRWEDALADCLNQITKKAEL